jgi:CheY-like chemotaxis protein
MAKIIMVVDDEDSLLELVSAILEQEGYEVLTVNNGEECLNQLKSVKPDLILLDMMMPGMSGREVCERIREDPETKGLKVAFITVAKFSETGQETLKKMEVVDYITKPFDNADLVKRIEKLLK